MAFTPKDNLSESYNGQKLVKELLGELYNNQIADEGDEYNKQLTLAYGSVCRALMDLESCQNIWVNMHLNLNGGKK